MDVRLFFEFLQVAIGNRETLSRELTDNDWQDVFLLLKKHALLGVGFTAVERLHVKGIVCPIQLRMQWYALVVQIEKRNVQLNALCKKVTEQYEHDGLATCILKGQGNCLNYPEELRMRRMSGDIDVWCIPPKDGLNIAVAIGNNDVKYVNYKGVNAVIEYARMQYRLKGIDANPKACYHHIEAPSMDGTEVEVHYRPAFLRSPLRNWRMQRWFENHADECIKNKTHLGFSMMTSSVNVVYQMCHLYTHIFEGGIGLRQLMDYYYALRVWHNDVMECKDLQSQGMWSEGLGTPVMSKEEVISVLRSFGMSKFTAAVMYVLQEVFDEGNENNNENEKCPQMNTDGHGCPQADGEWSDTAKLMSTNEISDERIITRNGQQLKEIDPQADGEWSDTAKLMSTNEISDERIITRNGQQLSKKYYAPWLICEPNEKEGRKLLAEIMQGGNFGQYDTRDAALKKGGMMKHGVWKLKRVKRLVISYPEEALWEPVFRIWHLAWRGVNG